VTDNANAGNAEANVTAASAETAASERKRLEGCTRSPVSQPDASQKRLDATSAVFPFLGEVHLTAPPTQRAERAARNKFHAGALHGEENAYLDSTKLRTFHP
jgi:hypothetical protein